MAKLHHNLDIGMNRARTGTIELELKSLLDFQEALQIEKIISTGDNNDIL